MTSATEAVQPFLASSMLGLHLNPCECSVVGIGRKSHSKCVHSIICQAEAVFLLGLCCSQAWS